jgi:4-hydroxy-tetrahydrodipicolinate synthase
MDCWHIAGVASDNWSGYDRYWSFVNFSTNGAYMKLFSGISIVALPTPFTQQDEVDYDSLAALVEWHIAEGTDAIMVCGSTGEAPTLSSEEQSRIIQTAIESAKGRVPVIAGTGTYNTKDSVKKTEVAQKLGAEACLAIVPYYNRPTPEGCLAHFHEIAKVGLPVIVYYHPGRTGVHLSPESLAAICSLENILAWKDCSGAAEMATAMRELSSIPILSGDDTNAFSLMRLGAYGVISIVANIIPRQWKEFLTTMASGNWAEAEELDKNLAPLYNAMIIESNPQCVKYALSVAGKCLPRMRLPLVVPRLSTQEKVREAMAEYEEVFG